MPRILLIDDNEAFLDLFLTLQQTEEFDIAPLTSAEDALKVIEKEPVDLIISDVQMPGITGIDLFRKIQDYYTDIPVILITAYGSTEEAIRAVKKGAFHYFEKPLDDKLDLFWTAVREALAKREMLREIASYRTEKSFREKQPVSIIGRSKEIRSVLRSIEEIADLPVTVLIYGETGTGKDLVAKTIHNLSERRDKPYFAVNCNEFAPGVLESELFGHEKGSFTGAINRKNGLFEIVHRGTLFLDEISDAPAVFQAKLLRVLETKSFTRVGGTASISSDFRIITATNRLLEEEVAGGRFRKDLYYRLNVYVIEIPPLRNRKEDIPVIAEFYLKRFSEVYRKEIDGISENALISLIEYDWPGNVRELINVIERAVITCKDSLITTSHLPFTSKPPDVSLNLKLHEMEKIYIELALSRVDNNKTKAAQLLGISRKTLIEKVKRYGIHQKTDS